MESRALGNQPTGKKREREKARRCRRPARALPGMMRAPWTASRRGRTPIRLRRCRGGGQTRDAFVRTPGPRRPSPSSTPPFPNRKKNQTKSEVPCGAASVAGGNSAESRVAGTRGDEASPHRLQRDVRATRAAYRGFGYRRARVPAVTSPERTALNLGGFSLPRTQFGAVSVVEPSPFSASGA